MEMETAGIRTGCNFTDEFCKPVVFCMGYLYPTWWKCYYLFLFNPMLKLIHTTWTNIIKSILYTYFTNLVSQGEFRACQVSCYLQQCWSQSGSSGLRLGHSPPTVCSSLLLYFLSLDPKEEILHHGNGRRKTAKPIHTWLSCMQWKIHVVTLMYEPLKISPPFSSSSLAVKQEKM